MAISPCRDAIRICGTHDNEHCEERSVVSSEVTIMEIGLLTKLIDSETFTAAHLTTPWERCLQFASRAFEGDEIDQTVIKAAREHGFSNIVLVDEENNPRGYVSTEKASAGRLAGSDISLTSDWTLHNRERMSSVAKRMASEHGRRCRLYFIFGSEGVTGVATYADFNRKVGYLYTYSLILALEHWVKSKIMSTIPPTPSSLSNPLWLTALSRQYVGSPRRGVTRDQQLIALATSQNENCLDLCYLKELLALLDAPQFAIVKSKMPSATLSLANHFRTRVAHPTKLLIPNSSIWSELENLAEFWDTTAQFVKRENIDNEKNRSRSSL
jgi:hypothetical protein